MLDKRKQYVLSVDGKKIAAGLGKPLFGDINLWVHEKPNLKEALCKRNEDTETLKKKLITLMGTVTLSQRYNFFLHY